MTKIKNEPMPRRPSNQSGVRVDFHAHQYYAVGGGVCVIASTREGALDQWNSLMIQRQKAGLNYK